MLILQRIVGIAEKVTLIFHFDFVTTWTTSKSFVVTTLTNNNLCNERKATVDTVKP